ncbi:TPA: Transcription factor dpl-1, variant 2 [Trebouxia sp. C0004]
MSDFATEIGIIDATGQIPGVRVQEEWNSIAEGSPDFYTAHLLPPEPQPSVASMQQGDRLLEAASKAAAKAAEAAEATRQRMQQSADAASGSPSMEAGTSNAAVNTPPTKPVRNKRSVLINMHRWNTKPMDAFQSHWACSKSGLAVLLTLTGMYCGGCSARPSRGSNSGGEPPPSGRTNGKGLRHFSMKALANQVCEKVESKVRTTYNEVADELVSEFGNVEGTGSPGGTQYDEKNIRRRVYDALNVLIAMEIISRSKKEILWHGLPSGHGNALERARADKICLSAQIDKQQSYLQELLKTQTALKNLIQRNRDLPVEVLAARNKEAQKGPTALQLPFILIQANSDSHVEIQISDDSRHAHFDFHSSPFKIHGDDEVLRHMRLHLETPPPAFGGPSLQLPQLLPEHASQTLLQSGQMLPEQTTPQVQMQIEADQQLAALQQQSRSSMQREWANAPMGNLRPAYGQHTNGQGSLDGHGSHDGVVMMSQNGSPTDDSPPDQSHVSGQRVPVTPKSQSLSPGLHGMALSPGTLLPQLPLHGLHQPQASLLHPSHGHASSWQFAQSNGSMNGHGHHQNGYSQGLASAELLLARHKPKQSNQGMPQVVNRHGRAVGHDPAGWNGRYDL